MFWEKILCVLSIKVFQVFYRINIGLKPPKFRKVLLGFRINYCHSLISNWRVF